MTIRSIINHLSSEKAVIFPTAFSGAYAAYPNGDRRRRPMCWLETQEFTLIQAEGVLRSEGEGFRISESGVRQYQLRIRRHLSEAQTPLETSTLSAQQSSVDHRAQHRTLEDREQFVYDTSLRSVAVNTRLTPLRTLSKPRRGHSQNTLSTAEVEAGERFAKDYEFANMGSMGRQNYESLGMGRGGGRLGASDLPDNKLDALNRVMGAMKIMGPGIDRVVTSVCVNELTLERLERTEKWMQNAGFTVLKLGLERLVEYYGTEVGQKHVSY